MALAPWAIIHLQFCNLSSHRELGSYECTTVFGWGGFCNFRIQFFDQESGVSAGQVRGPDTEQELKGRKPAPESRPTLTALNFKFNLH